MKHLSLIALCLALLLPRSHAAEIGTHGFFTMGYSFSNSDALYLQVVDRSGTFAALSMAGLQVAASINDRLTGKVQVITRSRPSQTFNVELDLAQIAYLASSRHQLLMGKLRLPVFMISDYQMVGALYPWNVPPPEVYELLPVGSVGSNNTFTGLNLLSHWADFGGWALDSEIYVGGSNEKLTPPQQEITARSKRLVGSNLTLGTEELKFRFSYLNTLHNSTTITLGGGGPPSPPTDSSLGVIQFITAGAKWEPADWLLQSEVARITAEDARFRKVTTLYATLGRYFADRSFLLHGTFASILSSSVSSSSLGQNSYTLGANYSLSDSAVLKLEASRVKPQSGPPGPGSNSPARPSAEMTVYHASVNFVF